MTPVKEKEKLYDEILSLDLSQPIVTKVRDIYKRFCKVCDKEAETPNPQNRSRNYGR